ncbi:helix-turn-helix domain-containing protein [Streptomyces uncialis]|uniref:helix-turn-helix domain-containing protein n=1 Tax=Streptomyces uncialis TaxID=1048205 RepID=UPI00224E7FA1|nr:helix-turn-helix transcriptional regulator [Streptomyces uncialis]MCX4661009.1 helix-turn-helix transcriptional regulator [Streptomyces uncialis]
MVNRKELDPESSPRAAFGARLRRSREEQGWTQDELSKRMRVSSGHISGVETTRKSPSLRFAKAADAVFGLVATVDTFERQWHEMHNGSLLEGYPEYAGYQSRAAEIRLFEAGVIPGLLQTPEYTRVLTDSAVQRGEITPEQAAERLDFLKEQQAALIRPSPPLIFAVLDESCIRNPIGGPTVMDAQLARLVEFASQSSTALQIAPFAMAERKPFRRLVYLLTMSDRSVMSYVESQTHGHLDRELSSVLPLVRAYHQLQVEAASQAETVDMIKKLRKGTLR